MQARVVDEAPFRIATLNINGVMSRTEFLREQDIDVMFVQEVTQCVLENIWEYNAYTILGTTCRGRAFGARDHLELQEITCLPSGRGIAVGLNGVWMVNIYAPSGA
jgi:exonuclease III